MNQLNQLKICSEATCNYVYKPDNQEGKCPKCGSAGIWLSNTTIGVNCDTKHNEHSDKSST